MLPGLFHSVIVPFFENHDTVVLQNPSKHDFYTRVDWNIDVASVDPLRASGFRLRQPSGTSLAQSDPMEPLR